MEAAKCGAKTRSGGVCKKPAMANGRCDMHGGKSTGRPLIHGRYSKSIPKRLSMRYEEALNDAELISMRDEAALVQSLIAESLEGLDLDNCEALWDSLLVLVNDGAERDEEAEWVRQVSNIVRDGAEEWKKVHRLLGYVESKRKLAETEAKRIKDATLTMTAKEAMALVASLAGIVREEFGDQPDRVARVTTKLAVVIGGRADEAAA